MTRAVARAGFAIFRALALAAPLAAQDSTEVAARRREIDEVQRRARESRAAAQALKGRENKELVRLKRTERDLGMTRRRLRAMRQARMNPQNTASLAQPSRL